MLNAARPYIDVKLDKQGYPLPVQSREIFHYMESLAAYNNRTQNVLDKTLALDGMSKFVRDFCVSFKSLRFANQDEDDEVPRTSRRRRRGVRVREPNVAWLAVTA